jgi:hypothetical protein
MRSSKNESFSGSGIFLVQALSQPVTSIESHSFSCSVTGRLSKRPSSYPTPHVQGKAPWLHGHYPASSLLWASPTPDAAPCRLWIPYKGWQHGRRRAGSPRFLDATVRTRPPLTPRDALRLHMLIASPQISGFTMLDRLATPSRLTRPKWVHLR